MASEVEIANLALAHIGNPGTVASLDPPEGSAQAEQCQRYYPIARDEVLEAHAWKFNTRRKTLALLDVDTFNWSYAYAEPNLTLRVLSVLSADASTTGESEDYETLSADDGSIVIYTNLEDATLLYTIKATDPTKYPPHVTSAISRLLAAYLAGPVIKGDAGRKEAKNQFAIYQMLLGKAIEFDANQRKVEPDHTPSFIGARF